MSRTKDKNRVYMAQYRKNNREAIAANQRRWVALNYEQVKAANKAWKDANPERVKAQRFRRRKRSPERYMWTSARSRARLEKRAFTIKITDIVIPKRCPLLGIPLRMSTGRLSPNSPSLDRKNNRRGYVPGNVWVISHKANSFKKNWSADEIVAFGRALKRNGC